MRALILAAGRGERMRPLTDNIPKPLLEVNSKPLIQYHVESLARTGITTIVINHALFGMQIERCLGDGGRFGVNISYSPEGDTPLETGGGVFKALTLLGSNPFIVVNADIWTDFPYHTLPSAPGGLAHLVLVPNPPYHPDGDFSLKGSQVGMDGPPFYTFSGIAVYRPELFTDCLGGAFPLAPLLRTTAVKQEVTGELYDGNWMDIGSPERLEELRKLHIK
jgi:N-acetyl-alpha-D-muramate 1-phosphate uridylyltransferase